MSSLAGRAVLVTGGTGFIGSWLVARLLDLGSRVTVLVLDHVVGFDLGTVEIFERAREDEAVGHLGPDLLGPDWADGGAAEAVRRLSADGAREIDVALLDQRNLAGLGNVYANELCFLRGVLPQRPVDEVRDLPAVVALAHRLITANRDRVERTTTGDLRPGKQTWVYGREGKPCRRCGTKIKHGMLGANELALRDTYWCPHCQR